MAYSDIEKDPWYEDVEVNFIEIYKTEIIIGVNNEIEDDTFSYKIETNIFCSVEAHYTDLSTGFYDKEYGTWWGEERRSEIKKYRANTLIYADFELEENKINGSFIEIEVRNFEKIE